MADFPPYLKDFFSKFGLGGNRKSLDEKSKIKEAMANIRQLEIKTSPS